MSIKSSTSPKYSLDKQIANHRPLTSRSREKTNPHSSINLLRPMSGKQNFLISVRQSKHKFDRDELYEINSNIKVQIHSLEAENLRLKTRISQLEKEKREENNSAFKIHSKKSLVPNIKNSIKDLKEKIKTKKLEIKSIKKNVKSTKLMEKDVELHMFNDELTRLSHHLEDIIKNHSVSIEILELEKEIKNHEDRILLINEQNIEYGKKLENSKEEIKEKNKRISKLEKPQKNKAIKKTKIKQEIEKIKELKEELISKISKEKDDFEFTQKKIQSQIESYQTQNKDIQESLRSLELKLREQTIMADQLKSQIVIQEKEIKRSQTNIFNTSSSKGKKMKNPPKLFQKIFMVIQRKKMFLDIFFSLMDKNSNGIIDIDEIYNCLCTYGNKIKKKYIEQAFDLMEISGTSIPLSRIQEYYEKYEYKISEEDSSSEEITEEIPKKKVVERLSYKNPMGNLPEGLILPNSSSTPPMKIVLPQEKRFPLVDLSEIKGVIEEIQKKMQKKRLPKSKLLPSIFGSDIDPYENFTVDRLIEVLKSCSLGLSSYKELYLLSRYLLERDCKNDISENEIKQLKCELLQLCKRITSLFEDWLVYTPDQVAHAITAIKNSIFKSKNKVLEKCKSKDPESTNFIEISVFQEICFELEIGLKNWEILQIEYYPEKYINYFSFISSIKEPKTSKAAIKLLSSHISLNSLDLNSVFLIEQGTISPENFLDSLQQLNLELTSEEQQDLLESVSTTLPDSSKTIFLSDLNKKLSDLSN